MCVRVSDCDRPVYAKGCCRRHYYRLLRYGDPLGSAPPGRGFAARPVLDRIAANVAYDGECLLWQLSRSGPGYGQINIGQKPIGVHRVVYELTIGPIPEGYEVDHVWERGCRNRHCVRPDHLEAVTPEENARRANAVKALGRAS